MKKQKVLVPQLLPHSKEANLSEVRHPDQVIPGKAAVASLAGDRTEVVASRVVGVTIGGNNRGGSDPTSAAVSSAAKFVPSVLTKQK